MRKKELRKTIIVVGLVTALAIGVPFISACMPRKPAAPPAEAEPIKVGLAIPITGWYAADGVVYDEGISFAMHEINEAGGLLGRPLEKVIFDTQNLEPEVVRQAADTLVGIHKVDVVHGGWSGWGPDVEAFGKYTAPFFHIDCAVSCVETFHSSPDYWNVFMIGGIEPQYGADMFKTMAAFPYEYPNNRIACIAADDAWGMGVTTGFKEAAEAEGWDVGIYEVVPYGFKEWGPILSKIRAYDPAIIEMELISPADEAPFIEQFLLDPINSLIEFGYGSTFPEFLDLLGENAEGVLGQQTSIPVPIAHTAEANAWVERFTEYYGHEPLANASVVAQAVYCWANAVEQVGDPAAHREVSRYMADNPYETLLGIMDFDEDQKIPLSPTWPNPNVQIQDGKITTIYINQEPYVDYLGNEYGFRVPPWIE